MCLVFPYRGCVCSSPGENYMLHGRDVALHYDEVLKDYLREFPCPQRVM